MHTITTSPVHYDADGLRMVGHLALPRSEGPWPSVLIGHDGIGLDEYQRSRADDLAARGYAALAMDYHGGQTFFGRPDAMLARTLPLMADSARMRAIGTIALNILRATPGADANRLAALGYGAGGLVILELARSGAPFEAIALVHPGFGEPDVADWRGVSAAFLLCTGSEDPLCTPEQVLSFGRVLEAAGIDWRANIYGGAKHAFWARPMNPDGSRVLGTEHSEATVPGVGYHPTNATRAWHAVLDLFDEFCPARPAA